jgi:2-polyprenyl-6-methoxyphenol hydroxylase-like FAD-dependent oxidoreductase
MQNDLATQTHQPEQTEQTTCCIVGSGPAGAVLALLLARQGIPVLLLEEHMDFDRDFRGDTVHPSVLEIMDQLNASRQDLRGNDTMGEREWKSEEKEGMCGSPNHVTPVRSGNPYRATSTV